MMLNFKMYILCLLFVNFLQREVDALKGEISVMMRTTAERKKQLQKEFETHAQIKKDIEVQQRKVVSLLIIS